MSLVKIGTLLLVSAMVACVLFVVIVLATPKGRKRPRLHRDIPTGPARCATVCSAASAALRTAADRESAARVRVRCQSRDGRPSSVRRGVNDSDIWLDH